MSKREKAKIIIEAAEEAATAIEGRDCGGEEGLKYAKKIRRAIEEYTKRDYKPDFGDDRDCKCGHPYYRHFDSYDNNEPVGCKYCQCYTWEEPMKMITAYLHMHKDDARERDMLTEEQQDKLFSALCEVKFTVDVVTGKIVTVNDKVLVDDDRKVKTLTLAEFKAIASRPSRGS